MLLPFEIVFLGGKKSDLSLYANYLFFLSKKILHNHLLLQSSG